MKQNYKDVNTGRTGFYLNTTSVLMVFISLLMAGTAFGRTGTIIGTVTEAETGKPLAAVSVSLQGTTVSTLSDVDGRYHLIRVPAGSQTLEFTMPGFLTQEMTLTVEGGARTAFHIELEFDARDGDRLFVRDRQSEWASAYTRQINSLGIHQVITREHIIQSGGFSVRDGLARMPGVQVGRRGELNIRGVGRNMFDMTVDGQRVASTQTAGRFVDPGFLSADMVRDVELIKVLTPDMDAEAISGVVRVNTWRPVGERELFVRAGGLADTRYNRFSGLGNTGSIHYAERYNEQFTLAADFSYQQDIGGFESLELNFGAFGDNNPLDVIEMKAPGLHSESRNRIGSRIQMNYQPDAQTSYFVQALLSIDNHTTERHRNLSIANGDWIDQFTTGNQGQQGHFSYNPFLGKSNDIQLLVQTGGRHLLDFMTVEYKAGWTRSNVDRDQYDFFFTRQRIDYTVNMDNRSRPYMRISNLPLLSDGFLDQQFLTFNPTIRLRDEHEVNRYSARLDVELPAGPLTFKVGSSGLWTEKGRSYEEADLSTLRSYNLQRFHKPPRTDFNVFDHYLLPWIVHTGDAARFVDISRPDMRLDEEDMIRRSHIWNYFATEYIYSGYGVASVQLGPVLLMGGARVEHTDADYEGRRVLFNQFNRHHSSEDTTSSANYTHLFPNARVIFSPVDNSSLKLAWSRSLLRQDYSMLAPFELINAGERTRFFGNPDLKPIVSDNLDLMYEHFLSGVGIFTAGVFHKSFSNRVFIEERLVQRTEFPFLTIPEGESIEITERTYQNSDETAVVYGVEVSWHQFLHFLPGILGNFGLNVNYTWTHSELENKRNGDAIALQFQSPHVINAAVDYNQGRFSGRVAWHWTASYLYRPAMDVQWAPAINRTQEIYLDWYEDGWTDVSASFELRITNQFRFWANVSNLFSVSRKIYGEERNLYPFVTELQDGFRLNTGLRFSL